MSKSTDSQNPNSAMATHSGVPELSLIVPTFNERPNLQPLVERVHRALAGISYELIVVDDNSPDGTAELAKSLGSTYPVRAIVRRNERGLASAVIAGFRDARGRVLGVIDADLQHPPEKIPALLKGIRDGSDVVIASRHVPGGGMEGWSTVRKIVSRGARMMAVIALPQIRAIKDPMSGFFLFRREVIDGVTLSPVGYKILLEVLVNGNGGKVVEVPYTFVRREKGQSKLTAGQQLDYMRHLYRLGRRKGWLSSFMKFGVVGMSGAAVNLGLLAAFVQLAGMSKLWSQPISYEVSIITNFILNELWTFRERRVPGAGSLIKRELKFNLVSLVGWGINFVVYYLMLQVIGIHYILAQMIAIGVAMTWNFASNITWTWRARGASKVRWLEALEPGGRSSRSQFAFFYFVPLFIIVLLSILLRSSLPFGIIAIPWFLLHAYLVIVVGIRRLHDLNRSGWCLILGFVPLLNLALLLYLLLAPGKPEVTDGQ